MFTLGVQQYIETLVAIKSGEKSIETETEFSWFCTYQQQLALYSYVMF